MILKSYRYSSAYNEYCEVNVEGAYINPFYSILSHNLGRSSGHHN